MRQVEVARLVDTQRREEEQRLAAAKLHLAYELIFERTYGIDLGVDEVAERAENPF